MIGLNKRSFLICMGPVTWDPLCAAQICQFWDPQSQKTAQNGPNRSKMTQKAGLTVLVGRNGWIVLDRGWIYSWGVPPNLLEAISGYGVSPILARVSSKKNWDPLAVAKIMKKIIHASLFLSLT